MAKHKQKRKLTLSAASPSKRIKQSRENPGPSKQHSQPSQHPPDVPFKRPDDVLLVGEGDFSFAHCLQQHYADHFTSLTATSLDPEQDVYEKYPQAADHIRALQGHTGQHSADEPFEGFSAPTSPSPPASPPTTAPVASSSVRVLHDIDATRLHATRAVRSARGGYDWIVFQFPHVGGKSTDVNRQVRSNQQLLVGFFDRARGLLRKRGQRAQPRTSEAWEDEADEDGPGEGDPVAWERTSEDGQGGRVLVTLFEGEPYTLWNIRDLARHSGYAVERSWRFRWDAFPGYSHARTLGNVKSRAEREGRAEDGERAANDGKKGAWKGEEREARTFVFSVRPEEGESQAAQQAKKRGGRRKGGLEEDSDSDI